MLAPGCRVNRMGSLSPLSDGAGLAEVRESRGAGRGESRRSYARRAGRKVNAGKEVAPAPFALPVRARRPHPSPVAPSLLNSRLTLSRRWIERIAWAKSGATLTTL